MELRPLDHQTWQKTFRRTLLFGLPNSWKTTSIFQDSDGKPDKAWPRPIHLMCFPGEQGAASICQQEGLHPYVWENPNPTAATGPTVLLERVMRAVTDILTGKYGPVTTLALDGLHKFYDLCWQASFEALTTAFPDVDEEKLRGRAYGLAHKEFLAFVQRINSSTVPYVVMTCWSSREKDDPENSKSKSHIWPDLPGEMPKYILGEFGSVLYAEPGQEVAPGKFTKGRWQTRKDGRVWGVGIKAPTAVVARIPTFVTQDWKLLEQLVLGTPAPAQPPQPKPAS